MKMLEIIAVSPTFLSFEPFSW